MLPIALTCPVWWVARWTARTLATLAVLVACSFGAATLPLGGPATAPVAATVVASAEGLSLRADAAGQLRAAADPATPGTGQDVRGQAVDAPALPAGQPRPAATPGAVTRAADRSLALAGLVPATVGSRAPPAR
ncbi:hypothetical protein RMN56_01685 [Micromonospora halotolerans]|uniref:Uncharacterized protein n=1 Tax=Micromonospora halotolerans TaxID=709879 RepID=A0ABY9ZXZ8_9ACTN|nr:hypothetical protein [Micromonospora halotolerans]WNM40098.1 hypothetical protein RMN56_01685 [Micromonospora halotolerans]